MYEMIEAVGEDLKASIDDLIKEIKKNRREIVKVKLRLGMIEPEDLSSD
ncbi:MAG: hypothetical protein WC197_02525 [Candidatus Gastranaerophilaceae bacterium]|jgi:hypothetical protein